MEQTYKSAPFEKNLLLPMEASERLGVSASRYVQAPGAGWTIAGIVSSQCGLPLKGVSFFGHNREGSNLNFFMPGATCLGDVLQKNGYRNVFLGGASLKFAGKGLFLKSHGYQKALGKEYWESQGLSNQMNVWGLQDHALFDEAWKEFQSLINMPQPFNLTILTVDTHHPSGLPSDFCNKRYGPNFEDIIQCSAEIVNSFIQRIVTAGYLDRVSIVVLGDHFSMSDLVSSRVPNYKDRAIFNLFIESTKRKASRNTITHFDFFPTILDSLGFQMKDGRIALGYSLFSETSPPKNWIKELNTSVLNRSVIYDQIWQPHAP